MPESRSMHRRNVLRWSLAAAGVGLAGRGAAADAPGRQKADPWPALRQAVFGTREIGPADGVIQLEAPVRAEDAAVVPIAVRALMPQTPQRYIRRIQLVIDNNPSPFGVAIEFTPLSGRADFETRVRVEEYTTVRAIAELNDGSLVMDTRFVKASGGCSAPAGKDAAEAMARLGRMRLSVNPPAAPGEAAVAQLMVSHPNISGLAIDQLTRLAPLPRFVRRVAITFDGRPVLTADVDFTLSENPNLRFRVQPPGPGELKAVVVDTESATFDISTPVTAS
ncbi:quinoprotein dehydrogenase-associated SoxYZ-like carrier [Rubrivivax gelatinosus]|uniref:quinoprotein dehydrogenase-associated SoxYZ-like carrier n=2 Tax=Rubrivivax gelatinosus TaxID=28068 RepID=UPI002174EE56|nr:quinoprotein dehydrogenase-associated SoxYZ-like carrier [Rubrivivax gelatinosus]